MKKPQHAIFLVIGLALLFVVVGRGNRAAAETSSVRCQDAQAFIQTTVRKNDLQTRVDRMQLYQFIHDNVEIIAARLQENSQPNAKQVQAAVNAYQHKIDTFKADYESYDEARQAVSSLPRCSNNQKEFNTLLDKARKKRAVVADDVKKLRLVIANDVTDSLDALQLSLAKPQEN